MIVERGHYHEGRELDYQMWIPRRLHSYWADRTLFIRLTFGKGSLEPTVEGRISWH